MPERRTFRIGIDHTPGPLFEGPLYRMPVIGAAATWLLAVALGVAREAIDELVALAQGKTPFSSSSTLRQRAVVQSKVGRAEGMLRSARAYLYDRIAPATSFDVMSKVSMNPFVPLNVPAAILILPLSSSGGQLPCHRPVQSWRALGRSGEKGTKRAGDAILEPGHCARVSDGGPRWL